MLKKRILITGTNGFIGSHLANFFCEKGFDVIGIVRSEETKNLPYRCIQTEDFGYSNILREYKPEIIIHCAGKANVSFSRENPDADFKTNYLLVREMLKEVCDICPESKLILFSSAAVYGNPEIVPIKENSELVPISPYGLHKLMMEETADYFRRICNLDITILRVFSAYGRGLRKQILWDMVNKITDGQELVLSGNGNESRDFIHIDDISKIVYSIITVSRKVNDTVYNIANGREITIREIAEAFASTLKELTGKKIHIVFNGIQRPGDPCNWCADISKLTGLGYEQRVSFEAGIRDYISWTIEEGIL